MRENTLLLQRPSIQALFDGYEFHPYGAGTPIPAPLLRKPKDKKQAMMDSSMTTTTQGGKQFELPTTQTNQQNLPDNKKQFNGGSAVIRNQDQSMALNESSIIAHNQFNSIAS